jgi:hypothetical protein
LAVWASTLPQTDWSDLPDLHPGQGGQRQQTEQA